VARAARSGARRRTKRQRGLWLAARRPPGKSKRGLSYAIQPGLGRQAHTRRAVNRKSPFKFNGPIDEDIQLAIFTTVVWGPFLGERRARQAGALDRTLQATGGAHQQLVKRMPPLTLLRSMGEGILWRRAALLATVLRWLDRALAGEYAAGHKIVGR